MKKARASGFVMLRREKNDVIKGRGSDRDSHKEDLVGRLSTPVCVL